MLRTFRRRGQPAERPRTRRVTVARAVVVTMREVDGWEGQLRMLPNADIGAPAHPSLLEIF